MVDSNSLRERAKQLRKLADTLDEAASGLEEIGQSGNDTQPRIRRSSITIEHASSRDLCYAVLRESGQPMHKIQIGTRLSECNRNVTENTIQSYLSRDKRLMSLGRGVWSLRPEPHGNNGG